MRKSSLLAAILSSALFFEPIPMTFAAAQDAQAKTQASSEMSIMIEQGLVRFTIRKAVDEVHLQVFDQKGDLVFDSGFQRASEVNWPLQTAEGESLKNGLYAYTLTTRESGVETMRAHRGHLIMDRVKGRDDVDKMWVTSQGDAGVGAEITVARDENTVIVGASGDRTLKAGQETSARDAGSKNVEAETKGDAKKGLTAALLGTTGRIAKFTTATDLGDSVMTEASGGIGIGTTTPSGRLHLHSAAAVTPLRLSTGSGSEGPSDFLLQADSGLGGQGRSFVIYDDVAKQYRFNINGIGRVGLGTPAPRANLHVHSAASVTPLRLSTGSGSEGPADFLLQADSGLSGQGKSFVIYDDVAKQYRMVINGNGHIGVGTPTPASNLQIEGVGPVEAAVTSRNERAILALGNTLGPARYTWTVESGVRGVPGIFGVYNRTVNKSGLEIDGNLNVYVKSLQITGGADLSEKFDVTADGVTTSAESPEIQPGMIVAIDPSNPGKLKLSRQAYDQRVAGVISGAGGVRPGMMMGQEGTVADGAHPVALSGRVYAFVDATYGAIKPGDLLTSSPTPGHAMKVRNSAKANGSIIGKAMTGLASGKGLVLTLVTLR